MAKALTPIVVLLAAATYAAFVPLTVLFNSLQSTTVVGSIFAAAILVRLNRGMPSLDWNGLDAANRRSLTQRVVSLTREYVSFLGVLVTTLAGLVVLQAIGPEWFSFGRQPVLAKIVSGAVGGGTALCLARMTYTVWRDLDIVTLQAKLIEEAGVIASAAAETKLAESKVANIRDALVRGSGPQKPRAWGE